MSNFLNEPIEENKIQHAPKDVKFEENLNDNLNINQEIYKSRQEMQDVNAVPEQEHKVIDIQDNEIKLAIKRNEVAAILEESRYKYRSIRNIKRDRKKIKEALNNDALELTEQEKSSLKAAESRYSARVLLDMGGLFDSTEMEDVQFNVKRLENTLLSLQDQPVSEEMLSELSDTYLLAIEACNYYCENRAPKSKSGIARKKAVEAVLSNMIYEHNLLTFMKNNKEAYEGKKLYRVLNMKKQDVRPENVQNKPKSISKNGKTAMELLESKQKPADILSKLSGRKLTAGQESFKKLIAKLREFPDNAAHASTIIINDTAVRLLQKDNGSLFIVEQGEMYGLDLTAHLIANNLERNLIENQELFGQDNVVESISAFDISEDAEDTGAYVRNREIMEEIIRKNTGVEALEFYNIPTSILKTYAIGTIRNPLDINAEDIRDFIKAYEEQNKEQINGAENLEILRKNRKRKEKLKESVDLGQAPAEQLQEDGQYDATRFSKQEKAYQNMIADMFYTEDTWNTDELKPAPGERMKAVIKKHMDTFKLFIRDALKTRETEKKLEWATEYLKNEEAYQAIIDEKNQKITELKNKAEEQREKAKKMEAGELPMYEKRQKKMNFFGKEFSTEIDVNLAMELRDEADKLDEERFKLMDEVEPMQKQLDSAKDISRFNNPEGYTVLEQFFVKLPIIGMLAKAVDPNAPDDAPPITTARLIINQMLDMALGNGTAEAEGQEGEEGQEVKEAKEDKKAEKEEEPEFTSDMNDYFLTAGIMLKLLGNNNDLVSKIERFADKLVVNATDTIQANVSVAADHVFPENAKVEEQIIPEVQAILDGEPIPKDHLLPGAELHIPEDVRDLFINSPVIAKADRERMYAIANNKLIDAKRQEMLGNGFDEKPKGKSLEDILVSATNGQKGQGRFFKLVLKSYFKGVDMNTKRSMAASLFRDLKPKDAPQDEDEELKIAGKNENIELQEEDPTMKEAGIYLGSVIKGAGPLLQKMVQGMPTVGLPKAMRKAINVTKSQLAPIPDEIVEAQFMSMVERSNKKVTKIKKIKSLGAASVGQAFLCRLYGPTMPEEGKEVVIKLLRPDVRNRMMKEKELMLKAAKETDDTDGMLGTYLGSLERIEKELDLTLEAKNCEAGHIYDGKSKGVKSMNVNNVIEPTMNSLVLEKAPGQTVDSYIAELTENYNEARKIFRTLGDDGKYYLKKLGPSTEEDFVKARRLLSEKLEQIEKRYYHLSDLSRIWVQEGLFGKGFYHGDLHAGNILINDDQATVIDYGNAVQLTEVQKEHITKMMGAAVAGTPTAVKNYVDSFIFLYGKEVNEEDRQKLTKAFSEVLNMGEMEDAGARIAATLVKAQELGFALPASIHNFSNCQRRLQNTLDELKELEKKYRDEIHALDEYTDRQELTPSFEPVQLVHHAASVARQMAEPIEGKAYRHSNQARYNDALVGLDEVNKEELLKEVRKKRKVKANEKKKIEGVDERDDFDKKYMSGIFGFRNQMRATLKVRKADRKNPGKTVLQNKNVKIDKNFFKKARELWKDLMDKYKDVPENEWNNPAEGSELAKAKDELSSYLIPSCMDGLTPQNPGPLGATLSYRFWYSSPRFSLINRDPVLFEEAISTMENAYNAQADAEDALIVLRKEQDSMFSSKEKLKELEEDFYKKYNRLHNLQSYNQDILMEFKLKFTSSDVLTENSIGVVERELEREIKTAQQLNTDQKLTELLLNVQERLNNFTDVYMTQKEKTSKGEKLTVEEKQTKKEAVDTFMEAYKTFALYKLKRFYKAYDIWTPKKKELPNFVSVMGDVLIKHWFQATKRLGGAALDYKREIEEMEKEKERKEKEKSRRH